MGESGQNSNYEDSNMTFCEVKSAVSYFCGAATLFLVLGGPPL